MGHGPGAAGWWGWSGFDYLRDNLALSKEETVLTERPLDKAYCLVDEVRDRDERGTGRQGRQAWTGDVWANGVWVAVMW